MKTTFIATAVLAVAFAGTTPAFAYAEGTYRIRNASQTPLSCRLREERGDAFYRFALRPGREIRQTLHTRRGERLLICSSSVYRRFVFRVYAGQAYELIETRLGELRLRTISRP
jgi:hypothetical protein